MSNVNVTEIGCRIAGLMGRNQLTIVLHLYITVLSVFGTFICTLLLFGCLKFAVFHPNVRVIIFNFALALSLTSTSQAMNSIGLLYNNLQQYENDCDYAVEFTRCCYAWCTKNVGIYAIIFSSVTLAIERLIATVKFKTYETNNGRLIPILTTCFQWLPPVLMITPLYLKRGGYDVPYCSNGFFLGRSGSLKYYIYAAVPEFVAFIAILVALFLNKRFDRNAKVHALSEGKHKLTERYQLTENVKVTGVLLRIVAVHLLLGFIDHIFNLILTLFLTETWTAPRMLLADLMDSKIIWYGVYACITCINASSGMRHFYAPLFGRMGVFGRLCVNAKESETNKDGLYKTVQPAAQIAKEHHEIIDAMWQMKRPIVE